MLASVRRMLHWLPTAPEARQLGCAAHVHSSVSRTQRRGVGPCSALATAPHGCCKPATTSAAAARGQPGRTAPAPTHSTLAPPGCAAGCAEAVAHHLPDQCLGYVRGGGRHTVQRVTAGACAAPGAPAGPVWPLHPGTARPHRAEQRKNRENASWHGALANRVPSERWGPARGTAWHGTHGCRSSQMSDVE